jgi:hypothetical protein
MYRGRQGPGGDSGGDVFLWIGLFIGLMFATALLYDRFKGEINYALLWVSYLSLWPVSFLSHYAAQVRIAMLHYRPMDLSFHQTMLFFDYAMGWWRIVTLPIFALIAAMTWRLGLDRYSRRFNARSLLEQQAKIFPVIAPALQRNFLEEPQHEGPWRMEESPIEWVVRRKILVRESEDGARKIPVTPKEIFDSDWVLRPAHRMRYVPARVALHADRLKVCLRAQLGPASPDRFDPDRLPCVPRGHKDVEPVHYRRALAAAFLLFALRERESAYALLNTFSGSFQDLGDRDANRIWYEIDTSDVDEAIDKVKSFQEYSEIVQFLDRHNSYVNPSLAGLLELAREAGELAPVRFLWLRAVDRSLWCALHQLGGRTSWAEALACWAHLDVEHSLGTSTHQIDYSFTLASNALEESLLTEGWMIEQREDHFGET